MFNQFQLTTSSSTFLRFKMINFCSCEILSKLSRIFVGKDENKRMKLPLSYVIRYDNIFILCPMEMEVNIQGWKVNVAI